MFGHHNNKGGRNAVDTRIEHEIMMFRKKAIELVFGEHMPETIQKEYQTLCEDIKKERIDISHKKVIPNVLDYMEKLKYYPYMARDKKTEVAVRSDRDPHYLQYYYAMNRAEQVYGEMLHMKEKMVPVKVTSQNCNPRVNPMEHTR